MVGTRTATAAAGIVVSLFISVLLWWYLETAMFFLFVPFVPFLFKRYTTEPPEKPVKECPDCGFKTRDESYAYCPRDGTRLE